MMKSPHSSASRLSLMLLLVLSLTLQSSDAAAAFVAPKQHLHYSASTSLSSRSTISTTTALAARSGSMNCRPIGIGSAAPATIITNGDLEAVVETSDDWIQSRTGIAQRRVLLEKETIRSLAIAASQAALDMAGVDAADIDFVICATSSADDMFGDASKARVVVSEKHGWLDQSHADPDGVHLSLVVERLSHELFPTHTESCFKNTYNYWRRYYFFGYDDDVLIFFDYSSLTQHPRTEEETAGFKSALAHMGSLYNSFPVLVVDYILETVTVHGHHLPYL